MTTTPVRTRKLPRSAGPTASNPRDVDIVAPGAPGAPDASSTALFAPKGVTTALAARPVTEAPAFGIVDNAAWESISGWAYDPSRPDEAVDLNIYHRGEILTSLTASDARDDLRDAGYGNGKHGFHIRLPQALFTELRVHLSVRTARGGIELRGSPFVLENQLVGLGPDVREDIASAVELVAGTTSQKDELAELAAFFLQQYDQVAQRLTALHTIEAERVKALSVQLKVDRGLSRELTDIAAATAAHYPPIDWDLHRRPDEPESMAPDVSVIVPVHNKFSYTYACIVSMIKHPPVATVEVIIVDDGSTDETVFASLVFGGGISVVRKGRNRGFVGSVNEGCQAARGRLLFLLNNDTQVTEGWLDELVATFDRDPSIGIAGSRLIYPDGRLQESGGIVWRLGDGWNWGRNEDAQRPLYTYMRDSDYVSGAALMIPRDLFHAVGGLSEEFAPAYYEDTDLCFKVRQAGWRVVVQPYSSVIHHEGVSAGTDVAGSGMKRFQAINQRKFVRRWREQLAAHGINGERADREAERTVTKRAMFVDVTAPMPDRDAGSNAAFEHMLSLQRLGYKVYFIGADNMARIPTYTEELERRGIQCFYAPYHWSVEEVLRREFYEFDVVYIHRLVNATKYIPMMRTRYPGAVIVYNVADLHYLRTERQAELEGSEERRIKAADVKRAELLALESADSIIVHSAIEEAIVRREVPSRPVTTIPWTVRMSTPVTPVSERQGLAFIGGYNHPPNVDAVEWLITDVMPLVWAEDPSIPCLIVGSEMPKRFDALRRPRVELIGYVKELSTIFERVRLTVAALRYGAGLKGKVLTSLASGVPCVATPTAVEGMDLPKELAALVGATPEALARQILRVHADLAANAQLAAAGQSFIAGTCSAERVDGLLKQALTSAPTAS